MSQPFPTDQLPQRTSALLDDVAEVLSRYVVFPTEEYRDATAAWVLHTHVSDAFDSTPRLAALSPEKGSGKTRLLELLAHLCHKPIHAANSSVSAMFRIIAKREEDDGMPPTILLDEADTIFGPKAPIKNEELRGLVNAGHRRGAATLRCVGEGASLTVFAFEAYAPVALAGIGALPDTIMQRAVIIPMRRRAPGETVTPFRLRYVVGQLDPIRDQLTEWGRVAFGALEDAEPDMPAGVEDRPADVWEPLLALGDLAGGDWNTRLRAACRIIVTSDRERDAEDGSLGLKLLTDLRTVWDTSADVMFTEDVLARLVALDESPWGDLYGKQLEARKLARYLKPYDVRSQTVRIGDRTAKGYRREELTDPWTRYLPPPPETASQAEQATHAQLAPPTSQDAPSLHPSPETAIRHNPPESVTDSPDRDASRDGQKVPGTGSDSPSDARYGRDAPSGGGGGDPLGRRPCSVCDKPTEHPSGTHGVCREQVA